MTIPNALDRRRLLTAVLAGSLASPAAAAGGGLGGGEPLEVSLGRIIAAMVICIIVALLAVLLIRQRGGKIDLRRWASRIELRPRSIEVVETRRLSPHADICLVRYQRRQYLLLLTPTGARILEKEPVAGSAALEPAPR